MNPKVRWLQSLVDDSPREGCRPWPWATNTKGYGQVQHDGRVRLVSHVVLELDGRPRPSTKSMALHSCDNPRCAAPCHLRWGTAAENTADMMARGRNVAPTGLSNGRARLSVAQVAEVRALRARGFTCAAVGQMFGITTGHVSRLARGQRRGPVD